MPIRPSRMRGEYRRGTHDSIRRQIVFINYLHRKFRIQYDGQLQQGV